MNMNYKNNIVGVTSSEWYLAKYGSKPKQEIIATQSHGVYGVNILGHNANNNATHSTFFMDKLASKGITFSAKKEESIERVIEARVKPESKGFTQSFSDIVKMKMSEALPIHDENDFKKMPFMNKNIGVTFSKVNFASKRLGTASVMPTKLNSKHKFGATLNTSKKYYTQVGNDIPKFDLSNFIDFVAKIEKTTSDKAKKLIQLNKVTVNNNPVTDVNYSLNIGDLVRVGLVGHFINNNDGIAIVK